MIINHKNGLINFTRFLSITQILLFILIFFNSFTCNENLSDSSKVLPVDNRIVIAWNQFAYQIANEYDQFYSFKGVRALAMTHISIHDALNAIKPEFKYYAFAGSEPDADYTAAISQAASEVLVSIYPDRRDNITTELNKWLAKVSEGKSKTTGIQIGKESANAIIKLRENDAYDNQVEYVPGNNIGDYQFTPEFDWVLAPGFRYAKPFGLTSTNQFRSPPPPDINSDEYTESYNEVKSFGISGSTIRNQDQTNYAYWWAEFAEHSLNRIGRLTAVENDLSLLETARMFALVNMTLYDIYLSVTDSKYFYNAWRPYTAIRMADKDENPDTEPDTSWLPEMLTPPWPEYPSAHASCMAGAAKIFSHIYSTSDIDFTMESITALPENKIRSYKNLDTAAEECAESRIMNGYHFRFSTEEGKKQGKKIAEFIVSHFFQPL